MAVKQKRNKTRRPKHSLTKNCRRAGRRRNQAPPGCRTSSTASGSRQSRSVRMKQEAEKAAADAARQKAEAEQATAAAVVQQQGRASRRRTAARDKAAAVDSQRAAEAETEKARQAAARAEAEKAELRGQLLNQLNSILQDARFRAWADRQHVRRALRYGQLHAQAGPRAKSSRKSPAYCWRILA